MLDIAEIQSVLSKLDGGIESVDLLKIGQLYYQKHVSKVNKNKTQPTKIKLRILVDMEDCLHRFYGGYYSDWACGGQWNRAYQFVQLLLNAFNLAQIELIIFFDGTLHKRQKDAFERNEFRQKMNSVVKHIRMVGTPPPKIWWLPPSGIRTCLRNAFRNFNIQVIQTVNDHTAEIIEYFHENKIDGILGLRIDYILSNLNRYFSSHELRLSYRGVLETKEFMTTKLMAHLNITAEQLPFVGILLGAHPFNDETALKAIHQKLHIDDAIDVETKLKRCAEIVNKIPVGGDVDEFIKHLDILEYADAIRIAVRYYQDRMYNAAGHRLLPKHKKKAVIDGNKSDEPTSSSTTSTTIATSKSNVSSATVPKSVIKPPRAMASETTTTTTIDNDEMTRKILNDVNNLVNDDDGDLEHIEIEVPAIAEPAAIAVTDSSAMKKETETNHNNHNSNNKSVKFKQTFVYTIPAEVMKTALNRHQRGMMDARIYHLLTKKEILLPQILEDEQYREMPSIHLFYRPARQMIYAILFNMYHHKYLLNKKEKNDAIIKAATPNGQSKTTAATTTTSASSVHISDPDIKVSEWFWSPQNEYKKAETVSASMLPWSVPTIQRLWFGTLFEDKQRRMKAFLTVMRSDTPLMLNTDHVPQHMLAMACVLRYIITSPKRNVITRTELDAFLATAFSPHIINVEYTQDLVLPCVHLRGVFLATLFMQGVETVALANDACGIPLPWTMTNPWLFFDGKLFHLKLKLASYVQNLRELCDDHIDIVLKIERFRKAILEDVEHCLMPNNMEYVYRVNNLPANYKIQSNGGGGGGYGGKTTIHPVTNIPFINGTNYYNSSASQQHQQNYFLNNDNPLHIGGGLDFAIGGGVGSGGIGSAIARRRQHIRPQQQHQQHQQHQHQQHQHHHQIRANNRNDGYQLKVGGVVVGSWAGGVPNKSIGAANFRFLRAARINNRRKGNALINNRTVPRNHGSNFALNRIISRNLYGTKITTTTKNKNKKNRSKKVTTTGVSSNSNGTAKKETTATSTSATTASVETATNDATSSLSNDIDAADVAVAAAEPTKIVATAETTEKQSSHKTTNVNNIEEAGALRNNDSNAELHNGQTVFSSDLGNSVCDILNSSDLTANTTTTTTTIKTTTETTIKNSVLTKNQSHPDEQSLTSSTTSTSTPTQPSLTATVVDKSQQNDDTIINDVTNKTAELKLNGNGVIGVAPVAATTATTTTTAATNKLKKKNKKGKSVTIAAVSGGGDGVDDDTALAINRKHQETDNTTSASN